MKLKNSQKMLKCVAELAYEKDLFNAFIVPVVSDLAESPVLHRGEVVAVVSFMKSPRLA